MTDTKTEPEITPKAVTVEESTEDVAVTAEVEDANAGTRQAHLHVTRLDPMAVLRTSFVLSLGLAIVVIVAMVIFWVLLTVTGTLNAVSTTASDIGGLSTGFLSLPSMLGFTLLLAAFEVVVVSLVATLVAVLYNIAAGMTGGIEVTLSED